MKTIPPLCPEPETGPRYWRSLDELANTPEFRQWAEREFPAGASELTDPVTRRDFVKIMSASFLLAGFGLTGCRKPEEYIYPFSKMPEGYVHGVAKFYASARPSRGSAIPLLVKSHEGRPTKVEGNPEHPDSNGGTDTFTQASILNLYDPDRALRFTQNGSNATREAALDSLNELSRQAQANGGRGVSFLLERSGSPSRLRLQKVINDKFPQARWFIHEPVDLDVARQAASIAFGKSVTPYYKFDEANLIVSLDCDFLSLEEDSYIHIRRFAKGRKVEKPGDSMNRLYAIEGLMTVTGANADHRLRVPTSSVPAVAARLAAEILKQSNQANLLAVLQPIAAPAAPHEKWIVECAQDLLASANAGKSLVVAGHRQPVEVHLIATAINAALGNIGKTLVLHEAPDSKEGALVDLTRALNASEVETLIVLGSNPAYTAPADLDWSNAQRKAKKIVRLGYYEDESFEGVSWHLPLAHYLESWGDARTRDGTLVSVQPLIEPLFGGITELEVLARIAGVDKPAAYDVVRETFRAIAGDNEEAWKKFLHDGFLENSASPPVSAQFNAAAVAQAIAALKPTTTTSRDQLEVVFHRDYKVDDGRYTNNGWLQELPDPITKLTWENVVMVSRKTAAEYNVQTSDVVEVDLGGRKVQGPIWVQPGMADYSVALALGYGRPKTGRVGRKTGFNAYLLRASGAPHFAVGAKLTKTGQTHVLASVQSHWSMEGRPIIREANLKQFAEHPDFAKSMDLEKPPSAEPLYANPLAVETLKGTHQWGMSIDLNLCVGCSACMLACQSENNVPIVGKQQVLKSREMHWLRIDRYFAGDPAKQKNRQATRPDAKQQFDDWIDDPQVLNQPMLCQHCEAAPCENVCPVNATVHDQEGLNVMVYNRCVGTRYCSNNCPYKVRRFNYFDYNKRPLDQLYKGPLAKRPQDELDLAKLIKNPDVTVRMRGVMEKCTFCTQRIEGAKIAQKVKAGASANIQVPEGTFTTACAQACPANAIVFGNLLDPESRVAKLKQQERNYTVLEFLATKPRLTYLAKLRNPNPAMPDYNDMPLSSKEFSEKMGENSSESHAGEHGTPAARPPEASPKGAQ